MSRVNVTVAGIQQAQQANLKVISQLSPEGRGGRGVFYLTSELWTYVVQITHRDTSALALSHRMKVKGNRGEIFIDPASANLRPAPRSGKPLPPPSVYGVYEHNRGGAHAFYDRTLNEAGGPALDRALAYVAAGVE